MITPEDYMGNIIGDLNSRRGIVNELGTRNNLHVVNAPRFWRAFSTHFWPARRFFGRFRVVVERFTASKIDVVKRFHFRVALRLACLWQRCSATSRN